MKTNECVVLAGGLGTRLKEVINDVPKCMANVAGKPFLYYILNYLQMQGISHVILSLGYKAEIIINWLKENKFPFQTSYVTEPYALGTGGAIKYAGTKVTGNTFFVLNGDTFFDVDLNGMAQAHISTNADITLALKHMYYFERYGSVSLGGKSRIIGFHEKQFCESGYINGGIYLMDKKIFSNIRFPEKFSFEKDILENKDLNLNLTGYKQDAYFIDIGIPEDYKKANLDFINMFP